MAHGVSHTLTRFLKSFQRKRRRLSKPSMLLMDSECLTPQTTTLPSAFFKQVRSLVEVCARLDAQQIRSSQCPTNSPRSSSSSNSSNSSGFSPRSSTPLVTAKMLDRIALLLMDTTNDQGKKSTRSIPPETTASYLLLLWTCVLQVLEVYSSNTIPNDKMMEVPLFSSSTVARPSVATFKDVGETHATRLSALVLLKLIIQRREFDLILMTIANGGCSTHHSCDARSRSNSHRLSVNMNQKKSKVKTHRSLLRRDKMKTDIPLCELVRKYMKLHQETLQFVQEALYQAHTADKNTEPKHMLLEDLVGPLVATSYVRVPCLRTHILERFKDQLDSRLYSRPDPPQQLLKQRTKSVYEEMNVTLFNWNQKLSTRCEANISPFDQIDVAWRPAAVFINSLFENKEQQMLLVGQIIQHIDANTWGRIEWKCIPGFGVLMELALVITKDLFENQLLLLETSLDDKDDPNRESVKQQDSSRECFPMQSQGGSPSGFFLSQVMKMLRANQSFIHDFLMAFLTSTNYLLPHHVSLCLQYLENVITEFPSYFLHDTPAAEPAYGNQKQCVADIPTLVHVFTCLLDSEHFEILKSTLLFLLKHFDNFSMTLRTELNYVFAAQFQRLFLHWHRDVRFCYYHVLIYLTYLGNRLVLGAKSDESLMGAEAAQLFDIPGLVRTSAFANWDAFDIPLHQALVRYKQLKKNRTPAKSDEPSWIDNMSFSILHRSIPEYKRHVQTYFACAKQLSLHERVPTPVFEAAKKM